MQPNECYSEHYCLERNTVNLFGKIDTPMAQLIIGQLQYLEHRFNCRGVPPEDRIITLQINSPGGNVTDGLAILDTMKYLQSRIRTVGIGQAASMASLLLSSGSRGMRFATANCEIMIHQPLGGASGQATDLVIAANHIERTRANLDRILAENTGKTVRQIRHDTERDRILTAQEALRYGLVDAVISKESKELTGGEHYV